MPDRMMGCRNERGFSTLELLVALVILSFGLMALIDFKLNLLERQQRQLARQQAIIAESNALALLRRINPAEQPVGRIATGDGSELAWVARPTTPFRPMLAWLGRETNHQVARFRTTYTISRNKALLAKGSVELVGRRAPDTGSRRANEPG